MRRFFIEPSQIDAPVISGSDARHIKNVLRLKIGDNISLFDGAGGEYKAQITNLKPDRVETSIIQQSYPETESFVHIIVGQAFLKEKKMDILVRHLTELGVVRWIPFITERSVPRPDSRRLTARIGRWKKIAKEAMKQCGRNCMPKIDPVVSFEDALNIGNVYDLKLIFWENETSRLNFHLTSGQSCNTIFVMLGPEGGFASREIELAKEAGFMTAGLGPRILRSETASIAVCAILQFFFGDIGKNA